MLDKGRIQIQGRYIRLWGSEKFNTLLELIDSPTINSPDSQTLTTKNLTNFIESMLKGRRNNNSWAYKCENMTSQNQNTNLREEPLPTTMKNSLTSLEADFVEFKKNTENTISKLSNLFSNKDEEIKKTKNRNNNPNQS